MQIFIETEQVHRKRGLRISCWGECTCPKFIRSDQLKQVLDRASLPGNGIELYVVIAD